MHQSNHTPEQRGLDVYLNGSIYTDYNETDKTPIGPNFTYNDKYMVIGPHSFKDGEDVTGRYELRYQWWGLGYWIPDEYYVGPREGERETRIVAIPLPSKGQEGEAERIHELKTWSKYFDEVFMGRKSFEVRKNDRDFKVGDILTLVEGDLWGDYPEGKRWFPTGRKLSRRVTHILPGGQFGIEEGYCVMSIA